MSTRIVMPKSVQNGDTVVIGDHKWMVTFLSEPDYTGARDASLVNNQGQQKWSCLYDAVTIEM